MEIKSLKDEKKGSEKMRMNDKRTNEHQNFIELIWRRSDGNRKEEYSNRKREKRGNKKECLWETPQRIQNIERRLKRWTNGKDKKNKEQIK